MQTTALMLYEFGKHSTVSLFPMSVSFYNILAALLISYWSLCSFAVFVTALNLPVPQAFKAAVRLSAARGKTWDTRPRGLGRFGVRLYADVQPLTSAHVGEPTSKAGAPHHIHRCTA
jgi:hypothetical protein